MWLYYETDLMHLIEQRLHIMECFQHHSEGRDGHKVIDTRRRAQCIFISMNIILRVIHLLENHSMYPLILAFLPRIISTRISLTNPSGAVYLHLSLPKPLLNGCRPVEGYLNTSLICRMLKYLKRAIDGLTSGFCIEAANVK